MKTFYALEPHVNGTTQYAVGDKREADEAEVQHLVDLKVLGDKPPAKPKGKAAEGKAGDAAGDGGATA